MDTNTTINNFLGTGWAFPPEFEPASGTVEMVSAFKDIDESLDILLSTSLGERVMQPRYGCELQDYLFEPLSSTVIGYIKDRVRTSILLYEPRIVADKVEVVADEQDAIEGRFTIKVEYTIPGTNSRFNYVFPYYKFEALKQI